MPYHCVQSPAQQGLSGLLNHFIRKMRRALSSWFNPPSVGGTADKRELAACRVERDGRCKIPARPDLSALGVAKQAETNEIRSQNGERRSAPAPWPDHMTQHGLPQAGILHERSKDQFETQGLPKKAAQRPDGKERPRR